MSKLQEKHQKMIEYQKEIKPFTPTVRQMAKVWGIKSTGAFYALNRMLKIGAVSYNGRQYYAIPFDWPKDNSVLSSSPSRPRSTHSRNNAIIEMRKTHKVREVAEAFGVTKQRVSQIVSQGR
jgi:hypothetical protein